MAPLPDQVECAVVMYVTTFCGFCSAAKRLLMDRGIPYESFDVTNDSAMRRWLLQASGQRTVPQIFIHGESIGGFQELSILDRRGKLAPMLGT